MYCVLGEVGTEFLGAFTELQKATITFVCVSTRPPEWNSLAPTRRIFMKFDI